MFPTEPHALLIILGGVFILIGLLGGGFEISGVKVPLISNYVRFISVLLGAMFLLIGVAPSVLPQLVQQINTSKGESAAKISNPPPPLDTQATHSEPPAAYLWSDNRKFTIETDTNRPGSDYARDSTLERDDPKLCLMKCAHDATCKAYTYTEPREEAPKAICFLRDRVWSPTPCPFCTSGIEVH